MKAALLTGQSLQLRSDPFARLALTSMLALGLVTVLLFLVAMAQLKQVRDQEAATLARLVANGLAQRVEHALLVGVPLDKLHGVADLFEQRLASVPGLVSLQLLDAQEHPLAVSGVVRSGVGSIDEPITLKSKKMAAVRIQYVSPPLIFETWDELLALLALALGSALLATEAARERWARRLQYRNRIVQAINLNLTQGDYRQQPPVGSLQAFDQRCTWLLGSIRRVNEQYARVKRMSESLRQTEPDAARRAELDALLTLARGQDQFQADAAPATGSSPHRGLQVVVPGSTQWHAHWLIELALVLWAVQFGAAALCLTGPLLVGCALLPAAALLALLVTAWVPSQRHSPRTWLYSGSAACATALALLGVVSLMPLGRDWQYGLAGAVIFLASLGCLSILFAAKGVAVAASVEPALLRVSLTSGLILSALLAAGLVYLAPMLALFVAAGGLFLLLLLSLHPHPQDAQHWGIAKTGVYASQS